MSARLPLALTLSLMVTGAAWADGDPNPLGSPAVDPSVLGTRQQAVDQDGCLVVPPGQATVVRLGVGHLNRIVTPFQRPEVLTTAQVQTEIRGSVIYIAPAEVGKAITLDVSEEGQPGTSLMLAIDPQAIPPKEVCVRLPAGTRRTADPGGGPALAWERSSPFLDTVRTILRTVALGQIPPGYTLESLDGPGPDCREPGLAFSFKPGQRLVGGRLDVVVGTVTNTSSDRREVLEPACGATPGLVAVAAWPQVMLDPGASSEVYVLRRIAEAPSPTARRSLLVEGGRR